jgi:proteasome lid subunit RPN8/RPN11
MGLKLDPPIKKCPYARGALGVVHIPPELIAELAGLVHDDLEWAVLLHGRREGLETWVERFSVPQQQRTGTSVDIAEGEQEDDWMDSNRKDETVGILHSHAKMGAFMSTTDVTKLNPRYPLSIVIAQGVQKLGFSYLAEGRVQLPCGSRGIIQYEIQPTAGDWPEEWKFASVMETDGKDDDFGDCKKVTKTKSSVINKYWIDVTNTAECGLGDTVRLPVADCFGKTTNLKSEIDKNSTIAAHTFLPAVYRGKNGQTGNQVGNQKKPGGGWGGGKRQDLSWNVPGYDETDVERYMLEHDSPDNWSDDPLKVNKAALKLVDVSGRFDYFNDYKCPKCKSEWRDSGTAGEESLCDVCTSFDLITPFNSIRRDLVEKPTGMKLEDETQLWCSKCTEGFVVTQVQPTGEHPLCPSCRGALPTAKNRRYWCHDCHSEYVVLEMAVTAIVPPCPKCNSGRVVNATLRESGVMGSDEEAARIRVLKSNKAAILNFFRQGAQP